MPPVLRLRTRSVVETRAVGEAAGYVLGPGDVVSLTGDLGAGKTAFVQGAAAGLGVDGPVVSPTFTLVREYEGRLHVFHLDVYRLHRIQDVLDLGVEEMLDGKGVAFIEWGDAVSTLLPDEHLTVTLTAPPGEEPAPDGSERRSIELEGFGRSWAERWDALRAAAAPWMLSVGG